MGVLLQLWLAYLSYQVYQSQKEISRIMATVADINTNLDTLTASVATLTSAPVATQADLDAINDKVTAINETITAATQPPAG